MRQKLRSQRETVISLPENHETHGETERLDRYASGSASDYQCLSLS